MVATIHRSAQKEQGTFSGCEVKPIHNHYQKLDMVTFERFPSNYKTGDLEPACKEEADETTTYLILNEEISVVVINGNHAVPFPMPARLCRHCPDHRTLLNSE